MMDVELNKKRRQYILELQKEFKAAHPDQVGYIDLHWGEKSDGSLAVHLDGAFTADELCEIAVLLKKLEGWDLAALNMKGGTSP